MVTETDIVKTSRNSFSRAGANGQSDGTPAADAVTDHLEKGKKFLAIGQLSDALTHFHAAIGRKTLAVTKTGIMQHFLVDRCRSEKLSRILSPSDRLSSHGKIQSGIARSQ